MAISIVILSVCVLLLLISLVIISIKCIDLNASCNLLIEQLSDKEENFGRAQKLVMDKFDYFVPTSKLYIEIAERELRKEQDDD